MNVDELTYVHDVKEKGREKEEKIKVNIKRVACKDSRGENRPSKGLIEKITIDSNSMQNIHI